MFCSQNLTGNQYFLTLEEMSLSTGKEMCSFFILKSLSPLNLISMIHDLRTPSFFLGFNGNG